MNREAVLTLRLRNMLALVALVSACGGKARDTLITGGDPGRGKSQIVAYGCGSCHVIPGVSGANGLLGPPLSKFAHRSFIGGEVSNTGEFLVRWITVPQAIEPGTD